MQRPQAYPLLGPPAQRTRVPLSRVPNQLYQPLPRRAPVRPPARPNQRVVAPTHDLISGRSLPGRKRGPASTYSRKSDRTRKGSEWEASYGKPARPAAPSTVSSASSVGSAMSWLLLRRNESLESDTSLSSGASSAPSSASDLASSLATRRSAYPASSTGTALTAGTSVSGTDYGSEYTTGTSVYGTDYGSEYTTGTDYGSEYTTGTSAYGTNRSVNSMVPSDVASLYNRERRRQRKFMRPGRVRVAPNTEDSEGRGRRRVSFMAQPTFVFGLMAVCAVSVGVSFYSLSVNQGYQASSAGTYTNEPTGTPTPIPTPTEVPVPTSTSYLDSLLTGGGETYTPTLFTPTPTVPTFTPTASPTTRGLCNAISSGDLEELSGLPAGAYVYGCALYDSSPQCAISSCEEYYEAEGEVYIFCDIETGELTVYGELICTWV